LIGLALLAGQSIWGNLPISLQLTYFIAMIALTGIPHGALDHIVANANNVKLWKTFSFWKVLVEILNSCILIRHLLDIPSFHQSSVFFNHISLAFWRNRYS